MIPIPPEIKILYDAALIEKGPPLPAQFHYLKWLRYYLDFCFKYHHEPARKDSFSPFLQKLRDKNQTEQQLKKAFDAVSIFYQIEKKKADQNNAQVLKNNNEDITTRNIKTRQENWSGSGFSPAKL